MKLFLTDKKTKEEYKKLWHDRIESSIGDKKNIQRLSMKINGQILNILSLPHLDLKLKAKFDKGMAEHGLGFEKVDFDAEIENEILDICNYFIGKHYASTTNQLQGNEE